MKKRCLVVDDDSVSREIVTILMQEYNIATVAAENGKVALDLCKNNQFDCAIIDLEMPQVGGFEFLEKKPFENQKVKPVIFFVTVRDYDVDRQHAIALGAAEFIIKPVKRAILKEKLKQYGIV